jgi:hypothetical protein
MVVFAHWASMLHAYVSSMPEWLGEEGLTMAPMEVLVNAGPDRSIHLMDDVDPDPPSVLLAANSTTPALSVPPASVGNRGTAGELLTWQTTRTAGCSALTDQVMSRYEQKFLLLMPLLAE